jgi:hypothetical protein
VLFLLITWHVSFTQCNKKSNLCLTLKWRRLPLFSFFLSVGGISVFLFPLLISLWFAAVLFFKSDTGYGKLFDAMLETSLWHKGLRDKKSDRRHKNLLLRYRSVHQATWLFQPRFLSSASFILVSNWNWKQIQNTSACLSWTAEANSVCCIIPISIISIIFRISISN